MLRKKKVRSMLNKIYFTHLPANDVVVQIFCGFQNGTIRLIWFQESTRRAAELMVLAKTCRAASQLCLPLATMAKLYPISSSVASSWRPSNLRREYTSHIYVWCVYYIHICTHAQSVKHTCLIDASIHVGFTRTECSHAGERQSERSVTGIFSTRMNSLST